MEHALQALAGETKGRPALVAAALLP